MKKRIFVMSIFLLGALLTYAQNVGSSPEYIKAITPDWKGERLADGRPNVSDAILERLKNISVEEAWGVLRNKGYNNQFEGNWTILDPSEPMTGRVVTAQYMPLRPDLEKYVKEQGKKENRAQKGGTNSWPIDKLTKGDLYVADAFGKVIARAGEEKDELLLADISLDMNDQVREGWGFLRNRRPDTYGILAREEER